jgi:glycosyltransferase involved in cell wall biosynthesis
MTVRAFLSDPIKKLSERYDIHIIANMPERRAIPGLEEFVKVIPVAIERDVSPLKDLSALIRLISIFRRFKFDAVQSVTPKAGLLAMIAAFVCRVPVRTHIFTGQVWATRQGLQRRLFKSLDWLIASLAKHVLVDSYSQKQFLIDEGVVTASKAEVLAEGSISGVNTMRFKPDLSARMQIRGEFSFQDDDVVILYVGRLTRDKGVTDLIQAFTRINEHHVHLLMVGPDEGRVKAKLLDMAVGCLERVHFVGYTDKPEQYMAAADIFCLPSYREGFGSVIIEAAAVGIPAIGSRIYGLTDAIENNVSGLLFEVCNVSDLAEKIRRLVNDTELRMELGRRARLRAESRFSSDRLTTAWFDFYREKL